MALHLQQYYRAFFRSRNLEDLIPYAYFLDEHNCLTKTGSVVSCFRIEQPLDDECLNPEEARQHCANLTAAYALIDPGIQQYEVVFRTRHTAVPPRVREEQPVAVQELERRREEHQQRHTVGASIEIYHCLEAKLPYSVAQLTRLSGPERRRAYRAAASDLDHLSRAYEIGLSDLAPRRLGKQEAFGLFHRLLHTGRGLDDEAAVPLLRRDRPVAQQLRDASVYWDPDVGCLRVGRRCLRVFTMRDLPDQSAANLFGEVLRVQGDFTIVTTWCPQERLLTKDQLIRLRTLIINFERTGFTTKRAMRDDPGLRQVLTDAGVGDDLAEINEMLGQLRRRRHTGSYGFTLLLHGDRLADLEKPATEINKAVRLQGASLHEEVGQFAFGSVLPVFFGCLPGNRSMGALRTSPLRNDHHAELSPVWSADTGERSGDYVNIYETRQGPWHRMPLRFRSVANRAVLGMTRQGKTTYEIDFLGALQRQQPLTRIYDVKGSYEPLAAYFGGSVLRCSLGEWNVPLNPFCGDAEDENFREFCFSFCVFLAESGGYQATYADLLQLNKKLTGLLSLPPKLRRMKVLVANIEGEMKYALSRWVEGGQYGRLFDHAEDELRFQDFQVFEFGQTDDGQHHDYLEALLTLLIYRDTATIRDPALRGRLKHITFDECVSHWQHPRLVAFIKKILQQYQAWNGSLSLVTQSPEDFGVLEPFVLQNCSSFSFFANPRITDAVLHRFGFDQARIDVFRGLRPREFLLHGLRPAGDLWKVLRLTLDPYRYWLYTTEPNEVVRREQVFREMGQIEGLRSLAAGGAATLCESY